MNNENKFDNSNDLPKQKDSVNPEVRQQIEIPQAYYDQKQAQEEARQAEEKQAQIESEQQRINRMQSGNLLVTLIVFGVLTYFCINMTQKKGEFALVAMLAIIIISSIASGITNKKKSNIPDGILAGGIMCAAITFVLSVIQSDNSDLWTYYALLSGIIAIAGYIISKLITAIIVGGKDIKAVQTIGIFLVLGVIIGTPFYLRQKYPEDFARLVLHRTREIVAESEEDFVIKTLKNRYGKDFTCGNKKTAMDYVLHTMVSRYMCFDEKISNTELEKRLKNASYDSKDNNYVIVSSIPYNENELQYIIEDDYLDILYLDKIKEQISTALAKEIPDSTFKISLYPNGNCLFVGDCADCEEYFAVGEKESELDVRFETSTNLDYSKEMNLTPLEFINQHEYKYIVSISGYYSTYVPDNHAPTVASAIKVLNSLNLENNFGFEITLKSSSEYNKEVYKVIGQKSSDKQFKEPKEIQLYDPIVTPEPNDETTPPNEENA